MPRAPELSARQIHVAAGILIDTDGRLLVTDRSRAKTMQEFWEFPGAKLAAGESAEDALRRELSEELGIDIASPVHFHSLVHDYPKMRVAIEFFLVRRWQGTPFANEGQKLQWLQPSEISRNLLLPADAPVPDLLQEL